MPLRAICPLYRDGPGVDYTGADVAYTAAVTLLHLPKNEKVSAHSEVLLAQKGSGDWHEGVWGSVTGYIDTMSGPAGILPDDMFDPVSYTARTELAEECGLPRDITDDISFRLGQRFTEARFGGNGTLHVLPILGICTGEQKPPVRPDGRELLGCRWLPLDQVAAMPELIARLYNTPCPQPWRTRRACRGATERRKSLNTPPQCTPCHLVR